LFWFLLLRWLWRHAVWGLLLRDLARLELRLVATHPDGAGGLPVSQCVCRFRVCAELRARCGDRAPPAAR
jgi:hypothetical protein